MTCVFPVLKHPLSLVMSMWNFSFSRVSLFCGWQQQQQKRRQRQQQQQHLNSLSERHFYWINKFIKQNSHACRDTKRDVIKFHFAKSRRLLFAFNRKAKRSTWPSRRCSEGRGICANECKMQTGCRATRSTKDKIESQADKGRTYDKNGERRMDRKSRSDTNQHRTNLKLSAYNISSYRKL